MFRRFLRIALALAAVSALAACGFRPLYAESSGDVGAKLQAIAVSDITEPEASGFLLQKELTRRLSPSGATENADYDLDVKLQERREAFAIQIDASVTRFDYKLTAQYTLTDRATGKAYKSQAQATASYNVLNSQFTTLTSEQETREKVARQLAERIQLDLSLHLSNIDG